MTTSSPDIKTQIGFIVSFLLILSFSCGREGTKEQLPQLEPLWEINEGFRSPESVIYDAKNEVLYVSNVNGYTKNGLGYLSRVSLDGQVLDQKWMEGLNGPTGMAISEGKLYVVDIDHLVQIDINNQEITGRFPAPDSMPGLNDVSINPDQRIFVSGSFSKTIYELKNEGLEVWFQDDQFRDANGLFAEKNDLYFVGYYLRKISLSDQTIQSVVTDSLLFDLESVEQDGRNGYFITAIGERPIWHLTSEYQLNPILERETFSADIEYINDKKMLLVPSGNNRLFAFRVTFSSQGS